MTKLQTKWPLAGVLSGVVILVSGAMPADAHMTRRVAPIERSALREQLGLTDDQVTAMKEIRARNWQSMRETVRALREARRALREMALTDADDATFTAKAAEVRELVGPGPRGARPDAPGGGSRPHPGAAGKAPRAPAHPTPPRGRRSPADSEVIRTPGEDILPRGVRTAPSVRRSRLAVYGQIWL